MKNTIVIASLILIGNSLIAQQHIGDFISVEPLSQTTDFIISSTHHFQKIIEKGDPLSVGGTLPGRTDFTGYVPIAGSSENGFLSINSELTPGGVSILDINYDSTTKLWQTTASEAVDFSGVGGTARNCSGTVTPWNTIISCEESISTSDLNADGYYDIGWCIEIDPVTKSVIDKRWALGNFRHENIVVHSNHRTVYEGADSNPGYLYKFVADNAQDLSSGNLYVYSGSKNGSGTWILIYNSTHTERNTTLSQSASAGGTIFNGIEDVEIGPDGMVYFAVKGESRVYRFQDSDPIIGVTVPLMETFVGGTSYTITHENGTSIVDWGGGNDNLAFDGDGNLWVLQDGEKNYIWVVENGHTQAVPKVKIFGCAPTGSEPTGITFSPDYRFLFMSIQHPSSSNNISTQTDAAGNLLGFDKDIVLVISMKDSCIVTQGDTTAVACDSFTWYGTTYTSSGTPTYTLTNMAGCDSVVSLNLTINVIDTSITIMGSTITSNDGSGNYQWIDCDNGFTPIDGETNQTFTATSIGSYAVIVSQNGCTDTSSCYLITSTGIFENSFNELSIYPNPTKEYLTIDLGREFETVTVFQSNLMGQVIYELSYQTKNLITFKVIGVPGVYLIDIHTANGKSVKLKVIKK